MLTFILLVNREKSVESKCHNQSCQNNSMFHTMCRRPQWTIISIVAVANEFLQHITSWKGVFNKSRHVGEHWRILTIGWHSFNWATKYENFFSVWFISIFETIYQNVHVCVVCTAFEPSKCSFWVVQHMSSETVQLKFVLKSRQMFALLKSLVQCSTRCGHTFKRYCAKLFFTFRGFGTYKLHHFRNVSAIL